MEGRKEERKKKEEGGREEGRKEGKQNVGRKGIYSYFHNPEINIINIFAYILS